MIYPTPWSIALILAHGTDKRQGTVPSQRKGTVNHVLQGKGKPALDGCGSFIGNVKDRPGRMDANAGGGDINSEEQEEQSSITISSRFLQNAKCA